MRWLLLGSVVLCVISLGCGDLSPSSRRRMVEAQRRPDLFQADQVEVASNTESYDQLTDNRFLSVRQQPLSTFSIDVDTASYANVRRFLTGGQLPPADAVRIEELVNYFPYDYPQPKGGEPFSVTVDVADCPWKSGHRLARIGLKGREIEHDKRPVSNLVFLIDVSGSMQDANKLPLVKQGLKLLVERLTENDRVAIAVYAGASELVLDSTTADQKDKIMTAIDRLQSGGSTNGAAGIELAYRVARDHFVDGGTNRVILCTDGDFNVGITSQGQLISLIQEKARSGIFLSVLGFGMGNYKDSTLEKLADKGNGNYGYIDSIQEARKVFVEQMNATLITIAKDVKIQIEFNPHRIASYRLIGYENRILASKDFHDDQKDAGEIGSGHTVTALYELVPVGVNSDVEVGRVDSLKYQQKEAVAVDLPSGSSDLFTLKLRSKKPDSDVSTLQEVVVGDGNTVAPSTDFVFATAVVSFGMLLRDSPHKGTSSFGMVLELAESSKGLDRRSYRSEFIKLVHRARELMPQHTARR